MFTWHSCPITVERDISMSRNIYIYYVLYILHNSIIYIYIYIYISPLCANLSQDYPCSLFVDFRDNSVIG